MKQPLRNRINRFKHVTCVPNHVSQDIGLSSSEKKFSSPNIISSIITNAPCSSKHVIYDRIYIYIYIKIHSLNSGSMNQFSSLSPLLYIFLTYVRQKLRRMTRIVHDDLLISLSAFLSFNPENKRISHVY